MGDAVDETGANTVDRRRILQAGAAGAVVAGTVASGAPALLGLTSAPGYAAAASGPPPTNPPPTTVTVTGRIFLRQPGTTPGTWVPWAAPAETGLDITMAPYSTGSFNLAAGTSNFFFNISGVVNGGYTIALSSLFSAGTWPPLDPTTPWHSGSDAGPSIPGGNLAVTVSGVDPTDVGSLYVHLQP